MDKGVFWAIKGNWTKMTTLIIGNILHNLENVNLLTEQNADLFMSCFGEL
jgi:hypothetical protein